MTSDRLDELEQRLTNLEEAYPVAKVKEACSRREFVYGGVVGAAGVAALSLSASAQSFPQDFRNVALLIGDDADKPDPNQGFFEGKPRFNYLYFAEDTTEMYTLQTDQDTWRTFADIMQSPTTSTDPGLAFDTWREPPSPPTFVTLVINLRPDSGDPARVEIDVDESGSMTADYFYQLSVGGSPPGDRTRTLSILIPDGGTYRIRNVSDPNNENNITTHREQSL